MPLAKTWSEEIVAEYLTLKGYLVITGLPIGTGKRGGRIEADVVAARAQDGNLDIRHYEVGILAENVRQTLKRIGDKFATQRREMVIKHFQGLFPSGLIPDYKCYFVATFVAKKNIQQLKSQAQSYGIQFLTLGEFLNDFINELKSILPRTPPEGLWFSGFLYYLLINKLLK